MAPLETKVIFQAPIFHFHDYGRKGNKSMVFLWIFQLDRWILSYPEWWTRMAIAGKKDGPSTSVKYQIETSWDNVFGFPPHSSWFFGWKIHIRDTSSVNRSSCGQILWSTQEWIDRCPDANRGIKAKGWDHCLRKKCFSCHGSGIPGAQYETIDTVLKNVKENVSKKNSEMIIRGLRKNTVDGRNPAPVDR